MKRCFHSCAILICGVTLLVGAASHLYGADLLTGEDRLLFAESLFNRQLYKQAAKEYARYLEDFPNANNNDELLCRIGEALRLAGDKQAACKVFYVLGKKKDSKYNTEALLKLSAMLLDIDRADEAEQISNSLIKKNPPKDILAEALFLHGSALVRLGRGTEAIADLDKLVRECGTSRFAPSARVALGGLLADPESNQLEKSEKLLKDAIASKLPTKSLEAECYFYLGCVHQSMKKYRDAINDFTTLITRFPEDARLNDVYVKLAWSYFFAGMYIEATTSVESILQSRGGFTVEQLAELRYIAANACFEVSNYDKAIAFYRSVLELDSQSTFALQSRFNLAKAIFNKENYAEVIALLQPLLNEALFREKALWLAAQAAFQLKNTELAVQNYRLLINEFPESVFADKAMYQIGCVYRDAQQREEAAVAFLQLAEKYPKSEYASDALFFAAHSYSIDEDDRALELWKRFVKEHSGDAKVPVATYHIAMEESRRGNNDAALDAYRLIYSAYPESEFVGEAYMWAGNILSNKGELVEAEKTLRKSLTYKLSMDIEQKAKFMLALTLLKQNKDDDAIGIMKGLLDNNVSEEFTPQHLAWLSSNLIERSHWADAEKAAVKLATAESSSDAWKQTGWALAAKAATGAQRFTEAEAYYRNALACEARTRDYIECCYWLGELLMKRKNFVEAGERFAEAAKLSADLPEFNELRIYSYIGHGHSAIAQGKRNEGIRLLTAASLLFSHDTLLPPVMKELIDILKEDGRMEEAQSIQEDLIRMYPNSAEAKQCSTEAK